MLQDAKVIRSAGEGYALPFIGPHTTWTAPVEVDVTALTDDEIDADGYLKPGVPFDRAGALIATGVNVYGVSIEPIKVAAGNDATSIAAASAAHHVVLMIIGAVNRAALEDILGRALTAFELAGFAPEGNSGVVLIF